jgi:RNase P subunit RPR2
VRLPDRRGHHARSRGSSRELLLIVGTIVGTIAIIAITIAIGLFADKKVDVLPRKETLEKGNVAKRLPRATQYAAGEVAATAIRAGAAQLAKLRETQRCTGCRAALVAHNEDRVRYAEHELIVVQFQCASCGKKRSLYVDPVA